MSDKIQTNASWFVRNKAAIRYHTKYFILVNGTFFIFLQIGYYLQRKLN